MIAPSHLTGLILSGGRATRMGGIDKGLQPFRGEPLVAHAVRRLRPQVARLLISANRHDADYARYLDRDRGDAVLADTFTGFPGPLAGILEGLRVIEHDARMLSSAPFATSSPQPSHALLVVPCDSPLLPGDLSVRLAEALDVASADIAVAATVDARVSDAARVTLRHPVFALIRAGLSADLADYLAAGERKAGAWYARHKSVQVVFDDERAFYNINTLHELDELERKLD
jgi:molybdopterin-guanine dinucleotide biosynthesis protein A